jgi:hypothetical protein
LRIFIGCGFRFVRAGRLAWGQAVSFRTHLAGLLTIERAVSNPAKCEVPTFGGGDSAFVDLETGRSIVNRPASGIRAQGEFAYSSQPARDVTKTVTDKNRRLIAYISHTSLGSRSGL